MAKKKKLTVESETRRLNRIFSSLGSNEKAVAQGLIVEAARLRVRLDQLWENIQEKGETELFTQSEKTAPYERERPQARLYSTTNKNYQSCIKQLVEMCPETVDKKSKLAELMND